LSVVVGGRRNEWVDGRTGRTMEGAREAAMEQWKK
jgi:hypothetical protein